MAKLYTKIVPGPVIDRDGSLVVMCSNVTKTADAATGWSSPTISPEHAPPRPTLRQRFAAAWRGWRKPDPLPSNPRQPDRHRSGWPGPPS